MDSTTQQPVLVLGGTGKTGRRVVQRLQARGRPVRVGTPSATSPFDRDDQSTRAPARVGGGAVVVSYNPGYQSVLKDLKQSTKQRFMAIEFDYPTPDIESRVVAHEARVGADTADRLVKIGPKVRNLKNHRREEGVSTRLLFYAGMLINQGVSPDRACDVALARPITDDPDMQRSIMDLVKAIF